MTGQTCPVRAELSSPEPLVHPTGPQTFCLTFGRGRPTLLELMKAAFHNLPEAKRSRILNACFAEFAARDYIYASLDRVIQVAGISKGGLYEYIENKEELYLYLLQDVYSRLYGCLAGISLPPDILERFRSVSTAAIDFYLEHPRCIAMIVRSMRIGEPDLQARAETIFRAHFDPLFDSVDGQTLRFPKERLIDLMKWLLAKTRADFMAAHDDGAGKEALRRTYMEEWDFLLSVMEQGIYRS